MKIRDGFLLRKLNNQDIAISSVDNDAFNGIIRLNPTSAFIWKCLENDISEDELITIVSKEYSINENEIKEDIQNIIETFKNKNLIIGE